MSAVLAPETLFALPLPAFGVATAGDALGTDDDVSTAAAGKAAAIRF
jgi:hypothetical protein